MSCQASCLVPGSINIDEFFQVPSIVRPGQTISSTELVRRAGGKGANQAVAVARAGGRVRLVGAVGADGEWVVRLIGEYGVDVSGVHTVREPTGRATIQLTEDGENCIILFPGANHADSSPADSAILPYTHVLLQNEILFSNTLAYLADSPPGSHPTLAPAPPPLRIFNPSPLPSPAQASQIPWKNVAWLIANVHEAEELLTLLSPFARATEVPVAGATQQENNPPAPWSEPPVAREVLRTLRALTSLPALAQTNTICTLGARGVLAHVIHDPRGSASVAATADCSSAALIYVPAAALQGTVRDSTGAGDCFTGYFVQGLMRLWEDARRPGPGLVAGADVRDTYTALLRDCVQAAAMCVERPGAMESVPTREEVSARMGR